MICLAVAGALAGVAAPPASAGTETVEVQATIEVSETYYPSGACGSGASVQVPDVEGATGYTVIVFDDGKETTVSMRPPYDDAEAPAGYHRAGLAGYNASAGSCSEVAAGYRNRFQVKSATATISFPSIEGRVVNESGYGMPDVKIGAKGPAKLSATSDFDGVYEIKVPDDKLGSYTVAPEGCKKKCRGGFDPERVKVDVAKESTATANFTGSCGGGKRSLRAGKFKPKHGLYGGPGFISVFYDCMNDELHAARAPMQMGCQQPFPNSAGGSIAAVSPISIFGQHGFPVGRERFEGRSFQLGKSFTRVNYHEIPGPDDDFKQLTGSLRINLDGKFVNENVIQVEHSAKGTGINYPPPFAVNQGAGGACAQARASAKLHFSDPAPPIFGGD